MNQELAFEAKCLQFFIRRYTERIERKRETGSCPVSSFQEEFKNDVAFYQSRVYASSKHKIGIILWEAMGTIPEDYMVLCESIANPKNPLEQSCPALAKLSTDFSLNDNWSNINQVYDSSGKRYGFRFENIYHCLSEYRKYLEKNKEEDFWYLEPSVFNGLYPLEYGLMIYMTNECAKIAWGHPNQATKLLFTYTQASGQQPDHIPLQKEAGREGIRSTNTDKAQDMYQNLSETWRIEFPSDFAVTDENKQKILGCKGSEISIDWAKIFEDHPHESDIWTGKEVNLWWHIIVARVVFVFYGQIPYMPSSPETCKGLKYLGDLYRLIRLANPRYLKLDVQGPECNDTAPGGR